MPTLSWNSHQKTPIGAIWLWEWQPRSSCIWLPKLQLGTHDENFACIKQPGYPQCILSHMPAGTQRAIRQRLILELRCINNSNTVTIPQCVCVTTTIIGESAIKSAYAKATHFEQLDLLLPVQRGTTCCNDQISSRDILRPASHRSRNIIANVREKRARNARFVMILPPEQSEIERK